MTDIIDIFLSPDNVAHINSLYKTGPSCGMRAHMHEFIYGPYGSGLYDIWTGTDADLYVRQINDEFLKYMTMRYNREAEEAQEGASGDIRFQSDAVEVASHLDPYSMERRKQDHVETIMPRRPIHARPMWSAMPIPRDAKICAIPCDCAPLRFKKHCAHGSTRTLDCSCRTTPAGTTRPVESREPMLGFTPERTVDAQYAQWGMDQMGAVHLSTRDDEGSDVGCLPEYMARFANSAQTASLPYQSTPASCSGASAREWLRDPTAGSGDAQYHLLVLDSQCAVLNDERTMPFGYGTTEEQLADDARIAARYVDREPEVGMIPKTSYKKLTHVLSAGGRFTLDDDRKLATDIFSRDSKGFILSGRR